MRRAVFCSFIDIKEDVLKFISLMAVRSVLTGNFYPVQQHGAVMIPFLLQTAI